MKKLMIALAAVAMAAGVQAAAVSWNSGTFNDGFTGPDKKTLGSSTAYTMTVAFFSDAGTTPVTTTGTSVSTAKPNGAYNTKTADSFAADTTYYVSAIITGKDATGKEWKREAALASFTTGTQGDANINFTTGAGFDAKTIKWGEWQSVPEPTSGLLLLLGVGALALRRRRA